MGAGAASVAALGTAFAEGPGSASGEAAEQVSRGSHMRDVKSKIRLRHGLRPWDYLDLAASAYEDAATLHRRVVWRLLEQAPGAVAQRLLRSTHLRSRAGALREGCIGDQPWFTTTERVTLWLAANPAACGRGKAAASDVPEDAPSGGPSSSTAAPSSSGTMSAPQVPALSGLSRLLSMWEHRAPRDSMSLADLAMDLRVIRTRLEDSLKELSSRSPAPAPQPTSSAATAPDASVQKLLTTLTDAERPLKPCIAKKLLEVYEAELTKEEEKDKLEALRLAASGLRVMAWNIQALTLASNPLEFVPAQGVLSAHQQQLYDKLLEMARELFVSEKSPCLGSFLGEQIVEEATELEKGPLVMDSTEGLERFLMSRQEQWPEPWAGRSPKEAAEQFLADYRTRWELWRGQTILQWLSDDQSGGQTCDLLPGKKPSVDEACWDLGLSSADRCVGNHPARSRAVWLAQEEGAAEALPSGLDRHDAFKLFIWDSLVAKVLAEAVPDPTERRELLAALKPPTAEERLERIFERLKEVDVAVLLEFPVAEEHPLRAKLDSLFWVASPTLTPAELQKAAFVTAVIARKSEFKRPSLEALQDGQGNTLRRLLSCELLRGDHSVPLHVLGVHVTNKTYDRDAAAREMHSCLRANTLFMAGDFNADLRTNQPLQDAFAKHEQLRKMALQAKQLPPDVVSTNKERSPLQAQVTKMFQVDCCAKDFLLLNEAFNGVKIKGYIDPKCTRLPNTSIPSDHAPLSAQLPRKNGASAG